MSAITSNSVDRETQQAEALATVSREFKKLSDEVTKTLDKSDRVAKIVFEAHIKIYGQGISMEETVSIGLAASNSTDVIEQVYSTFLKEMYSQTLTEALDRANPASYDFTFNASLRGSQGTLLQDRLLFAAAGRTLN